MVDITVSVDVEADVDQTWHTAIDWARQGDWIPLTTVRVTRGDGTSVGDRVVARTAIGPLGFDDEMRIAAIEPPHRCEVVHLGRVVRGAGVFEVASMPAARSSFVWTEHLELPLGAVGRGGLRVIRPIVVLALRLALRRFARVAATGRRQ